MISISAQNDHYRRNAHFITNLPKRSPFRFPRRIQKIKFLKLLPRGLRGQPSSQVSSTRRPLCISPCARNNGIVRRVILSFHNLLRTKWTNSAVRTMRSSRSKARQISGIKNTHLKRACHSLGKVRTPAATLRT